MGLGLSELRELRPLREENTKLKRLVAELSLEKQVLQDVSQRNFRVAEPHGCTSG